LRAFTSTGKRRKMRRTLAGAFLGVVLVPVLVWALTATLHWLRYGNWVEFWGLILAIQSIPYGFVIGAMLGFWLHRRMKR
jgi:hypothetical protein